MKLLHLCLVLALFAVPRPAQARCEGGSCSTCSNCSRCYHCSRDGGSCSVCAGAGSTAGTGSPRADSDASTASDSFADSEGFSSSQDPEAAARQRAEDERITRRERARSQAAERARNALALRLYQQEQAAKQKATLQKAAQQQLATQQAAREQAAFRAEQQAAFRLAAARMAGWEGKCVAVSDGDTLRVMRGGNAVGVKLFGVDAPEIKQPFGAKARDFVAAMAAGKSVKVYPSKWDDDGRVAAWVFAGRECLNRELLGSGLAWHAVQSAPNEIKLAALQRESRAEGSGLWSARATAPWNWRRGRQSADFTPASLSVANPKTGAPSNPSRQDEAPTNRAKRQETGSSAPGDWLLGAGLLAILGLNTARTHWRNRNNRRF